MNVAKIRVHVCAARVVRYGAGLVARVSDSVLVVKGNVPFVLYNAAWRSPPLGRGSAVDVPLADLVRFAPELIRAHALFQGRYRSHACTGS